jgi:hypothetical protein
MKTSYKILTILFLILFSVGCEKDTDPFPLKPLCSIEMTKIENTKAYFKISISDISNVIKVQEQLSYKNNFNDEDWSEIPISWFSSNVAELYFPILDPNTKYFYCIKVSGGYNNEITSEIISFTTSK